jgi:hypothetical protein
MNISDDFSEWRITVRTLTFPDLRPLLCSFFREQVPYWCSSLRKVIKYPCFLERCALNTRLMSIASPKVDRSPAVVFVFNVGGEAAMWVALVSVRSRMASIYSRPVPTMPCPLDFHL